MRSGLLIERDLWRSLQYWWCGAFLEPVYAEWMNMALLSGGLSLDSRDRRKFLAARWSARGWPWVDPLKDTEAGIKEIQMGLGSRTELLAEQGKDLEETLERLAEEQQLAAEYGVDVSGPKESGSAAPAQRPAVDDQGDEPAAGGGANRIAALVLRNGHTRR